LDHPGFLPNNDYLQETGRTNSYPPSFALAPANALLDHLPPSRTQSYHEDVHPSAGINSALFSCHLIPFYLLYVNRRTSTLSMMLSNTKETRILPGARLFLYLVTGSKAPTVRCPTLTHPSSVRGQLTGRLPWNVTTDDWRISLQMLGSHKT
jgi:hypothetical protein